MNCVRHPNVNADYTCATCGAPTCAVCVFSSATGVTYCPTCASSPSSPGTGVASFAVAEGASFAVAEVAPPVPRSNLVEAARALAADQKCAQHPAVVAKNMCDACHAWMCETCEFTFGTLHVCPRCAAAPPATVSDKRKNLAKAAYVAGAWSTVATVLLFVGNMGGRATEAENTAIGYLILVPTVAGLAMAWTTFEKRLPTPPFLRVPAYWNGAILAIYLLLIFIGTCR